MSVAIIKYNAGNLFSVRCALARIGVDAVVSDDERVLRAADRVIFPGVGEASTAMAYLREKGLDQVIKNLRQPVLGICIGLQLMCATSEEGNATCLGIFNDIGVRRFSNDGMPEPLKIPHMGWNTIQVTKPNALIDESLNGEFVYYVHSYYAPLSNEFTVATTMYGTKYSAVLNNNNFFATQFHPEKSGAVGERILENFMRL
ncbi:MAG: imidazole glycerol phosphate synthase subunit HisH [Muribaculaceae bacterium]